MLDIETIHILASFLEAKFSLFFFDLQARATSEIAVADLSDSENR